MNAAERWLECCGHLVGTCVVEGRCCCGDPAVVAAHVSAGAAADAIRTLNRLTAPGGAARSASVGDLDDTLIEIGQLLSRLPQALRQCADILQDRADAGRVADDGGRDVAVAVAEVRDLLGLANLAAQDAAGHVREAVQHTSRLYGLDGVSR